MARDYAAEYERREELAHERGFESYAEERAFREETQFERELAGSSEEWQERHGGDWRQDNPQQLAAFYENVLEPQMNGEPPSGMDKHNAVAYFIEWEDMDEDDAVAAMKEAFGYE